MSVPIESIALGPEYERRQAPQDHELWQDSVVLCWWDLDNAVGGYHRIGLQPATGEAHTSSAFFTPGAVLKRNESLPIGGDGFQSSDGTIAFEFGDHAVWTFTQDDVQGELHIADFHLPVDIYPKGDAFAERITSGHLEAGGRITGELTIEGTSYTIDGLAFRDRGWGIRYWEEILAHRWVCASFGPEATVLAVSVLSADGRLADFGCVIRDGVLTYSRDIDVVTYLERDGLTHRGGRVRMVLEDGEVVELEAEVLANNAAAGATVPVHALKGFVEDGRHAVPAS